MQQMRMLEDQHPPYLRVHIQPHALIADGVERRGTAFEFAARGEGVVEVEMESVEGAKVFRGSFVGAIAVACSQGSLLAI